MAIVTDKSGISPVDKSFSTPNRKNAGTPVGSLTPQYAGEMVYDTTNNVYFVADGLVDTSWVVYLGNRE